MEGGRKKNMKEGRGRERDRKKGKEGEGREEWK
jgi:hypothetical protein